MLRKLNKGLIQKSPPQSHHEALATRQSVMAGNGGSAQYVWRKCEEKAARRDKYRYHGHARGVFHMGIPKKHEPVKLIIGLIGRENLFAKVEKNLCQKFGLLDFQSRVLDFNFTKYYEAEMGIKLKRKFLSFKRKIYPERLADIKLYTNATEKKFLNKKGKRRINIDPGYLTLSKLVLATTKDYQHRLYLKKGIFAEVTLRYRNKTFTSWEWTYPDYRTPGYIEIFNFMRNNLITKKKKSDD